MRGVAYYPEQWDASLLEKDLDRIVVPGCDTVRIGEFCWHIMEKEEGEYDFSFFDKVIEEAKKRGLKIIFGTPTATAPAWLVKRYPEVVSKFENGQVRAYGGRHTCCYSSEIYFDRSRRIVRKLAEHYRDEKAIIAWQIDNELGHEGSDVCWCEKCVTGFRAWLKEKYGDIAKLNEVYGTVYCSAIGTDGDGIGKTQSGSDETTVPHTDGETGEKHFDGESVDVADGKDR